MRSLVQPAIACVPEPEKASKVEVMNEAMNLNNLVAFDLLWIAPLGSLLSSWWSPSSSAPSK